MFAAGISPMLQIQIPHKYWPNALIITKLNSTNDILSSIKLNKPLALKKMWNCCAIVPALLHADDAAAAFAQTVVVLQ